MGNTAGSRQYSTLLRLFKEGLTPVWTDIYEGLFICKASLLFSNDLNLTGFFSLHLNLWLLLKTKLLRQARFSCNYTVTWTDYFKSAWWLPLWHLNNPLIKGTLRYLLCKWHLASTVTQVPLSALTLQRTMQTKDACYGHSLQSFDKECLWEISQQVVLKVQHLQWNVF